MRMMPLAISDAAQNGRTCTRLCTGAPFETLKISNNYALFLVRCVVLPAQHCTVTQDSELPQPLGRCGPGIDVIRHLAKSWQRVRPHTILQP